MCGFCTEQYKGCFSFYGEKGSFWVSPSSAKISLSTSIIPIHVYNRDSTFTLKTQDISDKVLEILVKIFLRIIFSACVADTNF